MLRPEPVDPSDIDPALLVRLVKYPHHYDWEAVAELWPTENAALRFIRAIDRATGHTNRYDIWRRRSTRADLAYASELAGQLRITRRQSSKFARLVAAVLYGNGDATDDPDDIRAAWENTLRQKVTLAYLRESTENIACADLHHYRSVLDNHEAGMNAAYAREATRGQLGMFTTRQLVALSKTDIDPGYASGVCYRTRQSVADIKALVAARVPWNYMTPLLGNRMNGTTIARYWAENIPLEYAAAV